MNRGRSRLAPGAARSPQEPPKPLGRAPQPGDLVFAHTAGLMGKAIRLGEWLRFRRGSYWNHVCLVDRMDLHGNVYILQAEPRGVTRDKTIQTLDVWAVVAPPEDADPERALRFARLQVGDRYAWWTIVTLAVDILTPGWFPSLRPASKRSNSWICSSLTGEALRFGGWYHRWPSIYLVTPSQIYTAVAAGA